MKGLKKDVDELTYLGLVKYYVQAKRCDHGGSASTESVRALRGIHPDGYKGVLLYAKRRI